MSLYQSHYDLNLVIYAKLVALVKAFLEMCCNLDYNHLFVYYIVGFVLTFSLKGPQIFIDGMLKDVEVRVFYEVMRHLIQLISNTTLA